MSDSSILVIEDDSTIRENLQDYLQSEGYTVRTAPNGKVGLDLIRELKGQCLVLLDLQMPVMNGEQVLDELLRESPEVVSKSVVIITARVEPVKYQVRGFLRKPLDLDLLLSTIQNIL